MAKNFKKIKGNNGVESKNPPWFLTKIKKNAKRNAFCLCDGGFSYVTQIIIFITHTNLLEELPLIYSFNTSRRLQARAMGEK